MIKILVFFSLLFYSFNPVIAQEGSWSSISYTHSNGPVSPEYQYSYTIVIDTDGYGVISYRKNTNTQEEKFNVGRKGLQKLNSAVKKSNVLNINSDSLKSNKTLLGGAESKMLITMWQAANLDQKPPTIEVPGQVNPKYSNGILNLYHTVEMLVPSSVWNRVSD